MALGLLATLFAGNAIKMHLEQGQRDKLQAAINSQFGGGQQPGFGAGLSQATPGVPGATGNQPQINPDGSIGIQQGQAGLFPSTPGQIFQGGSQLFSAPGGAELGSQLMRDALAFQQSNQQQQLRFGQADQIQQNQFGQADQIQTNQFNQRDLEQENQQLFTTGQNEIRAAATLESQRLDRDQRATIAADRLAASPAGGAGGGTTLKASPGFVVNTDPVTKQEYIAAAPGSPPYVAAQKEFAKSESAVKEIDTVIEMLKNTGTELFGEQSARFGLRYTNIIAGIAGLQGLGVMQQGERDALEASLPDPSSISGATTKTTTVIAAYEELQKLFQAKLGEANQIYSLWGLSSGMATATPNQARELARQTEAANSAQQLGITLDAVAVDRPGDQRDAFGGLFPTDQQPVQIRKRNPRSGFRNN